MGPFLFVNFTAQQIADLLNGRVEGNPDAVVKRLAKIEEAREKDLAFLANPSYAEHLYSTGASVVLIAGDFELTGALPASCTLVRVDDPRMGFARLLEKLNKSRHSRIGIDEGATLSDTTKLGKDVYVGANTYVGEQVKIGNNVKIYPNCFIGDHASIGNNTVLHAGVKINCECIIGEDCTIHPGAVIGADGFGFVPSAVNEYEKMAQTGNVVIENQVEIGANTTIDRATLGSTIIRKGVKLDNLIQIAHNVVIGENTVIAAQAGIAGSTTIGNNCMIGGQVGIVGHLTIADNVKIAAQSGIAASITEDGAVVQGSPAFTIGEYRRSYVLFKSLPKLAEKLNSLLPKK